jgi:Putative restriction endonuclease
VLGDSRNAPQVFYFHASPLDMPAPVLVMEVVSPDQTNRERDYEDKRAQYQDLGVYQEARFQGSDRIISPTFPTFALTAEHVLNPPK